MTVSSFNPRLRIVSIIPGIESRAPERTATRKDFSIVKRAGTSEKIPGIGSGRGGRGRNSVYFPLPILPSTSHSFPFTLLLVYRPREPLAERSHNSVWVVGRRKSFLRPSITALLVIFPASTLVSFARTLPPVKIGRGNSEPPIERNGIATLISSLRKNKLSAATVLPALWRVSEQTKRVQRPQLFLSRSARERT